MELLSKINSDSTEDDLNKLLIELPGIAKISLLNNYMLMYKEILYHKNFPHRKFMTENRTLN